MAAAGTAPAAAAAAPAEPSREEWLARFPLRVEGGKVVDAHGQRFRLKGVNWYGGSDVQHVVGGLHCRRLADLAQGVRDMGFTVVRLPFSNQMMRPGVEPGEGSIDFALNPELRGLGPLEVFDAVVHALGACQVAVVPNNHCSFSAWGGEPDANGLWFCDKPCGDPPVTYSEGQFFEDWRAMARRYRGVPWVIGYDLRNEVRPVPGMPTRWPLWREDRAAPAGLPACAGALLACAGGLLAFQGACAAGLLGGGALAACGCGLLLCKGALSFHDWRAVAGRAGREILEVCPDKLVVVEQIVMPKQSLEPCVLSPPEGIPRSRLVFGVHCYAWSGPGLYIPTFVTLDGWNAPGSWRKRLLDSVRSGPLTRPLGGHCGDARCFGEMPRREQIEWYRKIWGGVLEKQLAPVWVSEFGVDFEAEPAHRVWFEALAKYLADSDGDYAYWPLNGGPKPNGHSEPYGLLDDGWGPITNDWRRSVLLAEAHCGRHCMQR